MITLRSGKYHNNVECSTLTLIFNDWSYQVQGSISLQKKQLPLCLCFCFCFSCHSASLFSRPNFLKPKSRLFFPKFSETEPKTLINWQKFQNRNITLCRIHINMLFQLAENSMLLMSWRYFLKKTLFDELLGRNPGVLLSCDSGALLPSWGSFVALTSTQGACGETGCLLGTT